jgi:signal transduction histidine kinase
VSISTEATSVLIYYFVRSYHWRMEDEIRTPLTLIKVPLEKVVTKAGNIPEIENSLKIKDRNTNRLIDLTNQLFDFRQIEMHKLHKNISNVINLIKQSIQKH